MEIDADFYDFYDFYRTKLEVAVLFILLLFYKF